MTDRNRNIRILCILYCAVMFFQLFARKEASGDLPYLEQMMNRINLTPFHTITKQFRRLFLIDEPWHIRHSVINLGGNILLFIPMGIFLPLMLPKLRVWWKVFLASAGIVTLVETVQVITLLGRCDIDDLILNLLGASVGYLLFHLIRKQKS